MIDRLIQRDEAPETKKMKLGSGDNVMITNLCDFCQFSAKIGVFLKKHNVMINFWYN
jgi:hypothetical protein